MTKFFLLWASSNGDGAPTIEELECATIDQAETGMTVLRSTTSLQFGQILAADGLVLINFTREAIIHQNRANII